MRDARKVKFNFPRKIVDSEYLSRLRVKSLHNIRGFENIDSLCDLFKKLSEIYAMLIYRPYGLKDSESQTKEGFRREATYAKDIRFDYINEEIFIPLFRYKYMKISNDIKEELKITNTRFNEFTVDKNEYIQYKQTLVKYTLYKQYKYTENTIDILMGVNGDIKIYRVDISNLPVYSGEVKSEDVNLLFERYIKCSYTKDSEDDFDVFFYSRATKTSLSIRHKMLLKELDLIWSRYTGIETFKALREYKLEDLLDKGYTEGELETEVQYEQKLIEFESYMYEHITKKVYWFGWSGGDFNNYLSGKWFFIKHKVRGIAIVFLNNRIITERI